VGITSGFLASDPDTAPFFRTSNSFSGYNRVLSGTSTGAFIAVVPASIYAIGLIKRDSYAQSTALLAAQAFADGFALDLPFKGITGRAPPLQYNGYGPYNDSFFNGTHNPSHSGGFYSVHAISSYFRSRCHCPPLSKPSFGSLCRVRLGRRNQLRLHHPGSNHFPSDVFFGGAMGFVVARYAVLPAR
jgi:hypothetical protein